MHLWYPSSKRNNEWTFLFFRVSLSANVDCTLPPIHFQGSPSLLANDAKGRSSISHFPQKMYNIDTDF